MKETITELAKRLSSIHFTLMITIGIVALPVIISNKTKIEKAKSQLDIILAINENWNEKWILDYAEETLHNTAYYDKLMPDLIYLKGADEVFSLESQTGKSYIINDPNL